MVRAQASVLGTFQMQRRRIGDLHCMAGQEQPAGQRHARTIILSRFRGAPGDRRGDAPRDPPRRRFPRLSILAEGEGFPHPAFRADRSRHGMVERSARPALLGMEGLIAKRDDREI